MLFCLLAWWGSRRLGWSGVARLFLTVLMLYGGAIFATPLPELAVRSLENRFPVPQVTTDSIAGIIVLGGASADGAVAAARGQPGLNSSAERLTTSMGFAIMALHEWRGLLVYYFDGARRGVLSGAIGACHPVSPSDWTAGCGSTASYPLP